MKKSILFLAVFGSLTFNTFAQHSHRNTDVFTEQDLLGFDKESAWNSAKSRYPNRPDMQTEYFEGLMRKYAQGKRAQSAISKTIIQSKTPYEATYDPAQKLVNVNLTPFNAACPNLGFEQQSFANWLGDTWTLSGINWLTPPVWTPGIVTLGNNTPAQPATGWTGTFRHTIMTVPPTVNNPPANCIGWDSIAINPVNHLSAIPFVPPTAAGVTCRLGSANTGGETERLRYSMVVTPQNSQMTISYAVILEDPNHMVNEQPFFQINLYNQNGQPIPGCGNYQIDATMAATDPTFVKASYWDNWASPPGWVDPTINGAPNPNYWSLRYYKPWTMVGVDLSAYIGQTITLECRTGDCSAFGHYGYAYIDASCGPAQAFVSMCQGSTTQYITAPPGFVSYQWYGPNNQNTLMPGQTNDSLQITNGVPGTNYWVQCVSASGCTTLMQATLQYQNIQIQTITSTPTCASGASGTASVTPSGNPTGIYSYNWVNVANPGVTVSTTNPATGLAPGTYSVTVTTTNCGSKDTTVVVGIAPPVLLQQTKAFCGNAAYLTVPSNATNIQWYGPPGNVLIPAGQGGTNDTLLATGVSGGAIFTVTYTNPGGCRDSLKYTLNLINGGTLTYSNVQNVCKGATNGSITVTMTPATGSGTNYNWTIQGPNLNLNYTNVTNTSYNLTNLAQGNYAVTSFDGTCIYGAQFKIDTIPVPVFYTVAPKNLCSGDTTQINFTFGGAPPSQCGLASTNCIQTNTVTVGTGNVVNSSTTWPAPYGHWYRNSRHQMLIRASELQALGMTAGKISSLALNVTATNGIMALPNFRISIGCTSLQQLTANQFVTTGLVQVYNAASYAPIVGWNVHNFTQSFDWDGVSSIIIETCYDLNVNQSWTTNCTMPSTNTGFNSCVYLYNDNSIVCGNPPAATFTWGSSTNRPNMQLTWCNAQAQPSQFTYNLSPNVGILPPAVGLTPPQTLISPPSTTQYTITTTSLYGNCQKQDTFTVFVTAPFNMNMPAAASFCKNASAVPITANFTHPQTGNAMTVNATWSGPGIVAGSNNGFGQAMFDPALAANGPNTLYILAGQGCTKLDSVVYTVNPWNDPTISNIGPFCIYDAPVQINAVTPVGTWSGPGVTATGLFAPAFAGSSDGLTPPYHTIKYVTNPGTPCADSASIQVEVHDKPTVNFAADTTKACAPNGVIVFTPNVTPVGGTYQWSAGFGNQTSTSANPTFTYSVQGTFSPKLVYTSVFGCKDSLTRTNYINIYQKYSAQLTPIGPFCIYDPAAVIPAASPNGLWSGPGVTAGVFNPVAAGVTTNLNPPYHTIKYVTGTGGYCPDSSTIQVQVFNRPVVNFTASNNEGCAPNTSVSFVPNVSPAGGTFAWTFGDGSTGGGANTSHTYVTPGIYSPKVSYTDPNGCKNDSTATGLVIVHPTPDANFYGTPNPTTILEPEVEFVNATTIGAEPTGVATVMTWNWDFGLFGTSNLASMSPPYIKKAFEDAGTYAVTLTATTQFGCTDAVTVYIKVEPEYVIYIPNTFTPNGDGKNDFFSVEGFGINEAKGFKMSIFDRWGQKVYETDDINKGWDGKYKDQPVQEDTYIYRVTFKDSSGKNHIKTGHVNVMK